MALSTRSNVSGCFASSLCCRKTALKCQKLTISVLGDLNSDATLCFVNMFTECFLSVWCFCLSRLKFTLVPFCKEFIIVFGAIIFKTPTLSRPFHPTIHDSKCSTCWILLSLFTRFKQCKNVQVGSSAQEEGSKADIPAQFWILTVPNLSAGMSRRVEYTVYNHGMAGVPRLNHDLYKMHLYFTKVAVSVADFLVRSAIFQFLSIWNSASRVQTRSTVSRCKLRWTEQEVWREGLYGWTEKFLAFRLWENFWRSLSGQKSTQV